jgi:CheY-like chemotaxis protein
VTEYRCYFIDSGRSALDCLAAGDRIDLLLIDVAMPGMNGVETVRRAREQQPFLKVLFVSGYADTNAIAPIGRDPLLQKPYQLERLAHAVSAVLQNKRPSGDEPVSLTA